MANLTMTGILEKVWYQVVFIFIVKAWKTSPLSRHVHRKILGRCLFSGVQWEGCWLSYVDLIHFTVQMTGKDKDYRYMATSDLLNELNKEGFRPDADLEVKLSNIVLQQLDDAAGDVSGLAVKWFGPIPLLFPLLGWKGILWLLMLPENSLSLSISLSPPPKFSPPIDRKCIRSLRTVFFFAI